MRDRGGLSSGMSFLTAMSVIRRTQYDVAIDLQGLLKSASIARLSGASRVVGFNGKYAREPLARAFYTSVHDPGGAGMYAPGETRNVVDINLGVVIAIGIDPRPPEYSRALVDGRVGASACDA